jgi:trk system potassium uptake protein TrkH
VVARYLAQTAIMLALLAAAPLAVSLWFGEHEFSIRYSAVIVLLLLVAVPALRLPAPRQIQPNEALVVVALVFGLTPLVMTYPLAAGGLDTADALFEAVSAITTTGLSTVHGIGDRSYTFLFARAWMQWYGGLGIVVLSVALLMGHHMAARRLTEPASGETLVTTARAHARRMLGIYATMTVLGAGVAWFVIGDGFVALTHVLAAVSTGGFSMYDNSLAAFEHWPVRYTVVGIAMLGAIPLPLYYQVWHHGWREAFADVELRALAAAAIVVSVLLALLMSLHADMPWRETLAQAVFLGVSAQTTTGFSTMDVAGLDPASKLVVISAMVLGGGVGSTAGGIKLLRLLILLRVVQLLLIRTAMPVHGVATVRLGGRALDDEDIQRALMLIALLVAVVVVSWLAFLVAGYAPIDALFEVTSATGTVGLSTGIAGSGLAGWLKAVLCADMLLGRLEVIALLVVLYPRTWIGKRAEYP